MGKPSMFSNNYKQQLKRRRINTTLFILLIVSIGFFGGKYYLDQHNISLISSTRNNKIVQKVSNSNLWSQLRSKFIKKKTIAVKPAPIKAPVIPIKPIETKPQISKIKTFEYVSKSGEKYNVEYEELNSIVIIKGLKDDTNTSNFDISKDNSSITFDVKADNNIMICDSKGNFKVISRGSYKTISTRKVFTKESIIARYKGYIWAAKPHFTLDGRVIYVSRLPFIRQDNTLYVWSMNIDGSNNKNLFKLGRDINMLSYEGYDNTGRLKVKISGVEYYLAKGSYMLVK